MVNSLRRVQKLLPKNLQLYFHISKRVILFIIYSLFFIIIYFFICIFITSFRKLLSSSSIFIDSYIFSRTFSTSLLSTPKSSSIISNLFSFNDRIRNDFNDKNKDSSFSTLTYQTWQMGTYYVFESEFAFLSVCCASLVTIHYHEIPIRDPS